MFFLSDRAAADALPFPPQGAFPVWPGAPAAGPAPSAARAVPAPGLGRRYGIEEGGWFTRPPGTAPPPDDGGARHGNRQAPPEAASAAPVRPPSTRHAGAGFTARAGAGAGARG